MLPFADISQDTLPLPSLEPPPLTKDQESQSSGRYYNSRRKPNGNLRQPRESRFPG